MIRRFRFWSARPVTRTTPRTQLRLEGFEPRDVPAAFTLTVAIAAPAGAAPVVTQFTATDLGSGQYLLTGQVTGAAAGSVVTFGGSVPGAAGQTAKVAADGSFTLLFQIPPGGEDTGCITAVVTNTLGQTSDQVLVYISP